MIIDYWEKKIEFEAIDLAIDSTKLTNYWIGDINIYHEETHISFNFQKKDLIAAAGIIYWKWYHARNEYEDDLLVNLILPKTSYLLVPNIDTMFNQCVILNLNIYTIHISSMYNNLLDEKAIVCYYNTNDMHNDHLLDRILKFIHTP